MKLHRLSGYQRGIPLYHGSKFGIEGGIQPLSRKECDFGKAFYMGTFREQAFSICCWRNTSKYYDCRLYLDDLSVEFLEGISWALFIGYNRGDLKTFSDTVCYQSINDWLSSVDVVIGDIADDSIALAFSDFIEGRLTDIGLKVALSTMKLGQQFASITQKACNQIETCEVVISDEELQTLRKFDEERRSRSESILRDISRVYRRVGYTIDDYVDRGVFNKTFKSIREGSL